MKEKTTYKLFGWGCLLGMATMLAYGVIFKDPLALLFGGIGLGVSITYICNI